MEKPVILITPRSLTRDGHSCLQPLKDAGFELAMPWPGTQPTEDQLAEVIGSCVGYLAGVERVSRKVLERAEHLSIITRNGVGIDNIDLEAAKQLGIIVAGTPGANAQGVAELTIGLIFNAVRSISWSSRKLKEGAWDRIKGRELSDCTLGVIGCGEIGRRTARMAISLGMNVLGYDLYEHPEMISLEGFGYVPVEDLLKRSDVVSLHCPATDRPLISQDALDQMKDGVHVINTARSALVDDQAMLKALNNGHVASYSVDAFDTEPPELSDLLTHEGVTLTPHIGGFTVESIERAAQAAVELLLKELKG